MLQNAKGITNGVHLVPFSNGHGHDDFDEKTIVGDNLTINGSDGSTLHENETESVKSVDGGLPAAIIAQSRRQDEYNVNFEQVIPTKTTKCPC
jgi:hypothetical protein